MVDVAVNFNVGEDEPLNAEFETGADVTFTADLMLETATNAHDELVHRDYPDQHPISAITGLEEALNQQDKSYVFEQAIASAEWDITHPLGKYPSVTISDSAGNVQIPDDIEYITDGRMIVRFVSSFAGKAFLN